MPQFVIFFFVTLFAIFYVFGLFMAYRLSFWLAFRLQILDRPSWRKSQKQPIPLLGLSFSSLWTLFWLVFFWQATKIDNGFLNGFFSQISQNFQPLSGNLGNLGSLSDLTNRLNHSLLFPIDFKWLIFGSISLLILGFLDDAQKLKTRFYILLVLLTILPCLWLSGLKIETVWASNLNNLSSSLTTNLLENSVLSRSLAILWIFLCMMASKFIDGLDGLCSSIAIFGFVAIFITASFSHIAQPLIMLFALLWLLNALGFLLFWNFPPAKMYMGEAGSTLLGFWLGILSLLAGAKMATVSTILGWFIWDIFFVFLFRILAHKNPLMADNSSHWQYRLKNLNWLAKLLNENPKIKTKNIGIKTETESKFEIKTENKPENKPENEQESRQENRQFLSNRQVLFFTIIILFFSLQIGLFASTGVKLLFFSAQGLLIFVWFLRRRIEKNEK